MKDELVGVLSFNAIEPANKTGYMATGLTRRIRGRVFFLRRSVRLCAITLSAVRSAL